MTCRTANSLPCLLSRNSEPTRLLLTFLPSASDVEKYEPVGGGAGAGVWLGQGLLVYGLAAMSI
jgi:hypothetical protein